MAGQPVQSPFGNLGPAGQGGDSLSFYSAPTGTMGSSLPPSMPPGVSPPVAPQGVLPPGSGGGFAQQPGSFPVPSQPISSYDDDIENEPPILEELGINVDHVWQRMQGIAFFKRLDEDILRDLDLTGPLVILFALLVCLVLSGKFIGGSTIYGVSFWGCVGIFFLINVMSQKGGIDMYSTCSILLYGLIPIDLLAFVGIFVSLKGRFGALLSLVCVCWSTATSSRFFANSISMEHQRWLVAYPVLLVYTCFALITIF
jgi:hypothetical protein